MKAGGRLRRLDDRVLGRHGITAVCVLATLMLVSGALDAVRREAWLPALLFLAVAVIPAQAATRSWRARAVR